MENLESKFTRLITTYKIHEALSLLLDIISNYDFESNSVKSNIMLLSGRYHNLKQEKFKGTISSADALLESNQILDGILGLSESIFKRISQSDKIGLKEKNTKKQDSKIIYDSKNFLHYEGNISIGVFNTERKFKNIDSSFDNGNLTWTLTSEKEELVGINFFLRILKGVISFDYQAIEINPVMDNLIFHIIPMKSNYNLIEVGSTLRDDPDNAFSPFRIRKVGRFNQGDGIRESIEFDFTETPEATESFFAPRINEGSPRPNRGKMKLRNIKIIEK